MIVAVLLYGLTAPPILLLIAAFLHRECRLYRAVVNREERMDREFFEGRWDWDFDSDLAQLEKAPARRGPPGARATRSKLMADQKDIPCDECNGVGELTINRSWHADPQYAEEVECHECRGTGLAPIREMIDRGEEHIARVRYGDQAVDTIIRGDLEADGWDFAAVVAHANGFEWDSQARALHQVAERMEATR